MLTDEKIYYYRIHRKGSILFQKTQDLYDTINLFYQLKNLILKSNNSEDYIPVLNSYIVKRFVYLLIKSKLTYRENVEIFKSIRKNVFYKNMKFYYINNNILPKIKFFLYYNCLNYNIGFIAVFKLFHKLKIFDILKAINRIICK